ncbi:MAG: hypothetical protein ACRCTZ_04095, partial [Sarcina sp.]
MGNKLNLKSISMKIGIRIILMCIVIQILNLVMFFEGKENILKNLKENTSSQISGIKETLNENVEVAINALDYFEKLEGEETFASDEEVISFINNFNWIIPDVERVIYTKDGKIYDDTKVLENNDYIFEYSNPFNYKNATITQYGTGEGSKIVISKIIDENKKVEFELNFDKIFEKIKDAKIGTEGFISIVHRDNEITSAAEKNLINNNLKPFTKKINEASESAGIFELGNKYDKNILIYDSEILVDGSIVGVISDRQIEQLLLPMRRIAFYIMIVVVVATVLIVLYLRKTISKGLDALTKGIVNLEEGKLSEEINLQSNDEFEELVKKLNKSTQSLRELMKNIDNEKVGLLEFSNNIKSKTEETKIASSEITNAIENISYGSIKQVERIRDCEKYMEILA